MDPALERFAANVKALRVERGLTQETLAHASGIHPTNMSRLETADAAPRFTTIIALARALDVPPGELFNGVV